MQSPTRMCWRNWTDFDQVPRLSKSGITFQPSTGSHFLNHASADCHQFGHKAMGSVQRLFQERQIFHVFMDHLVPQCPHLHPVLRGVKPAQGFRPCEVIDKNPNRFSQRSKQPRHQFVPRRILQSGEPADKGLNPFSQFGIGIKIYTLPVGNQRRVQPLVRQEQDPYFPVDNARQPAGWPLREWTGASDWARPRRHPPSDPGT